MKKYKLETIVFLGGAIGMGLELIACSMDKYYRNNFSKYELWILDRRKKSR